MHVINHRQHGQYKNAQHHQRNVVFRIFGGVVAAFIVANLVMFVAYRNKALPNYAVGFQPIGGKSYADIDTMVRVQALPDKVTVTKDATKQAIPIKDLHISVNRDATMKAVKSKPILPLISLIRSHTVPLVLHTNASATATALVAYDDTFSKQATDKHIAFDGAHFVIKDAEQGYTFDEDATAQRLITEIADGKNTIAAAVKTQPAGSNTADLTNIQTTLEKQIQTKISLTTGSQKTDLTPTELGMFYTSSGNTMAPDATKIGAFIDATAQKADATAANRSDLTTAIIYALGKSLASNFRISTSGQSTLRTYCTTVNGMSASELGDLNGKLAATYADVRGWNDGGLIAFKHVDSGCGYTVVLAAPSKMTSYGAICDNYYNCQVGTSVIVNGDRWLYATDPWNKTGQNLETYRQLIINHETGHRLGFRDNNVCSAPGQPAPVMSQQSIDLLGCVFNVWPLQSELDNLKSML